MNKKGMAKETLIIVLILIIALALILVLRGIIKNVF